MASHRVPIKCKEPVTINVKGVHYSRFGHRGMKIGVPTTLDPRRDSLAVPRFPCFEAVLGAGIELHETWVICYDGMGVEHRFLIAAQYRPNMTVNRALKHLMPGLNWKGDLLVMRGGNMKFVVNVGKYAELARQAVCKYLEEVVPTVEAAIQNNIPIDIPLVI